VVAFLRRAVAFFALDGMTVHQLLTDNGSGYRSLGYRSPVGRSVSDICARVPTTRRPTSSASSAPCSAAGPVARSIATAASARQPLTMALVLQPSPQTLGPRPQATGRPITPANQRFRYFHL